MPSVRPNAFVLAAARRLRGAARELVAVAAVATCLAGAGGWALAAAGTSPATITVVAGDTLWGLAQSHGTTVAALQKANGLSGGAIRPGMHLVLPKGSNATPDVYVVQPGDTLFGIALSFHLTVADLIAYNHLSGAVIQPGEVLKLHATTSAPAPLNVTVQPGDTVWGLAQRYGVTVDALASANHLGPNDVIRPGSTLTVPGRHASPTADTGGPVAPLVTVTKGESLWSIAHSHSTTVAALMGANDLSSAELFPGQTLRIVPPGELGRAVPPGTVPLAGSPAALIWPIRGTITSYFGYRLLRVDGSNFHTGLDIAGHMGEPIRAATGGLVTLAGWNGGYGKCIIVSDGNTEYYYGHASVLLVRRGEMVHTGQVIARVGSTGWSTGPHLHFEIRVGNMPVDPLPFLDPQATR